MIDRAAELALLGCVPMVNAVAGGGRVIAAHTTRILARYMGKWEVWDFADATSRAYVAVEWAEVGLDTVPQDTYGAFLRAIRP